MYLKSFYMNTSEETNQSNKTKPAPNDSKNVKKANENENGNFILKILEKKIIKDFFVIFF